MLCQDGPCCTFISPELDSRRIAEALSGRPQHGRDRLEPVYRVVKDQPSFTIQQQLKVTRVTNTESA